MQGNTRDVVAIKCILKGSLSKTATENLFTEIKLLKKLDHEHIVKLKDFEVSVGVFFLCGSVVFELFSKPFGKLHFHAVFNFTFYLVE